MAWFKQDKAELEALTAEQLSYSHSDAHLEDKSKFINGAMTRKATFKSLEWPELTVQVVGNNREQCRRATSLGLGKRARRQSHQYQNRRHAGLAETGRQLEAPGACVLAAAASIAARWLASCAGPPHHLSAAYCGLPSGEGMPRAVTHCVIL